MPQSKILVDTNAYIRLAKTVRPLLFQPFGKEGYCLYIIPELNNELTNKRLASKFTWVDEAEYKDNRKHFPTLSKKQKQSIAETFDYVWDYVITELTGPSKVDALYIAYTLELDIPVVTDDQDMTALAKVFDAKAMPTLQLLRIMLDSGHITIKTINGLVEYWRHIKDKPANLEKDYHRFFGSHKPK